jgi:hypothetical protein
VKFLHRVFVINSKNFIVDSVGVPQCVSKLKKTLRVDLTSIIVLSTRSTVQIATQRADLPRKVFFYAHAFVSNQKSLNVNENNNDLKFMCIMMCLKQGMQCSVKCIYIVHCTAPHYNKIRIIHITLCSVKYYEVFFLHSAVF